MVGEVFRAVRALVRRPVFCLSIVGTLAATISAQLTGLTLLDRVVLRPLPYEDPGSLVSMRWILPTGPEGVRQSEGTFLVLRDQNRVFDAVGIARSVDLTVERPEGPTRVAGVRVSPSMFDVLRVSPVLGRGLVSGDSEPGAAPVVVLSHAEWSGSHDQAPDVIGRSISVDGVPREIVGVQPPGAATFPIEDARLILPTVIDEAQPDNRAFFHEAVGRLSPGLDLDGAVADLDRLKSRLSEAYPGAFPASLAEQVRPLIVSLRDFVGGPLRPTLLAVVAATTLLLVVAVANVGSLLAARATARGQEFAIRAAVGASRSALMWTQVVEPGVLVAFGTLAGVGLTGVWLTVLSRLTGGGLGVPMDLGGETIALGALATAAGVWSLLSLFAVRPWANGGRAARRAGVGGLGTHEWVYTTQVAITVVLMVGALGLTSSFLRLLEVDPGFTPHHVTAARVSVTPGAYPEWDELADLHRGVLDRTAQLPGVRRVGIGNYLPLRDGRVFVAWYPEERPPLPGEFSEQVLTKAVSDGYFEALGIGLREGRSFTRDDWRADAPPVAMVNEVAAELFWGGESPIGRRIQRGPNAPPYEVIGVATGVRDRLLTDPPQPMVYQRLDALTLTPGYNTRTFSIAVAHDPGAALTPRIFRAVLDQMDPGASLYDVERMETTVRRAQDRMRLTALLLVSLAGAGLVLSVIGLYGGVSYRLSRRAREMGVRIALGASFPTVARQALTSPAVAVVCGITVGLFVASAIIPFLGLVAPDAEVGAFERLMVGLSCAGVAAVASTPAIVRASRGSVVSILGAGEE